MKAPEKQSARDPRSGRRPAPPSGEAARDTPRAHAVINSRSGTAMGKSPDELKQILTAAFAEAGRKLTVEMVEPGQIGAKLEEAASGDAGAMIVGGGDGTVRSAAALLLHSDKALGIVPLGTVNRLARDLGIPLDPQDAARALAKADVKAIDVAKVNEQVFLCNSMIGLTPQLTEQRQELRGQPLGERLAGFASVFSRMWRKREPLALTVEVAEEKHCVRVLSLVVSNNCYAERPSLMPHRPHLDEGCLGLYLSKHQSGARLSGVLLKAAVGRWRGDPNIEHFRAPRIVIDADLPHIKASTDGEVETLTFPLTYTIVPRALKVLAPRASA